MEKSDVIRRAVRQIPAPAPPTDFTARLMARVQLKARQRERRETHLLTAGGVGCFAALIAACLWVLGKWPSSGIQMSELQLNMSDIGLEIPQFTLSAEDKSQLLMWSSIALISLLLILADLLIRRHIAASSRN